MDQGQKTQRLKKELGFFSVFALATGTTLSAGFFLLPGYAAAQAGPAVVLAYIIAAMPLIPAALSIVELATAMPRAGGTYYFLDRSLGPLVGTIGGLGTWLALVLKTSFALIGMGAYLSMFSADLGESGIRYLAVAFALFFGIINLFGAKGVGKFQVFLVSGLLIILPLFLLTGTIQIDSRNFVGFFDAGLHNILGTAGLVYISYVGVTNVASVAEEVKNPEQTLPRAIFLSLGVTILIYALGTAIMVGVLGVDRLSGHEYGRPPDAAHLEHDKLFYAPVAATAKVMLGNVGMTVVSLAAILAFFSVANAGILSASRYPLAMSRDHLIPRRFQMLSEKGNPILGVIVTVAVVVALLLLLDVKAIAKLASAFQLLMFALLCVSVIAMRESRLDSYDPGFRSPLYPWTQIIGIVAPFVLISQMGWQTMLFSAGMVACATVWYFKYAKDRVNREGAIFHVFQRLGKRRHEALDAELRLIMVEKGLREDDPFDEIITRADVIDLPTGSTFEDAAHQASRLLSRRIDESIDIENAFLRVTQLGQASIGSGVALPHLRVPGMELPEIVLVRCVDAIPLEYVDNFGKRHSFDDPVRAVFFLISPEENPSQHLRILAHLAGQIADDDFLEQWIDAVDEHDLREVMLRNERYVSVILEAGKPSAEWIGKRIDEIDIAEGCLAAVIRRADYTFVPRPHSVLREKDRVTVIGEPTEIKKLYERFH